MCSAVRAGLIALVVGVTIHSAALADCPRNGGTLCVGPGQPSHIAATSVTLIGDLNQLSVPTFMFVVWQDDRTAATTGADVYLNSFESCVDSTATTGTPIVTVAGG